MAHGSRLVMSQGPQPGKTFILDRDALTIGRDPGNDIVISEPQVSRQHAQITCQGNFMVLEDLGSTNGTFVNGMRLNAPHTLTNGDVVGMGDAVVLTFYGTSVSATETVISQPPAQPVAQPTFAPPPTAPLQPPMSQRSRMYAEPVAPSVAYADVPTQEKKRGRTWLLIGCAVLLLLALMACVGVFVLDYLTLLPPIFYEPLRWPGLI